jgi:subtilisin-like proprotein convertase family protein
MSFFPSTVNSRPPLCLQADPDPVRPLSGKAARISPRRNSHSNGRAGLFESASRLSGFLCLAFQSLDWDRLIPHRIGSVLPLPILLVVSLVWGENRVSGLSTFSNSAPMIIPDQGEAAPFPSSVVVSGVTGSVNQVTVTLNNFSHSWLADLTIWLIGPAGQSITLLAGAGRDCELEDVTITFDDAATATIPVSGSLGSGTYQPSNYAADGSIALAPSGATLPGLSSLSGTNPNGQWSLFVMDNIEEDQGTIAGGWSLQFTTSSTPSGTTGNQGTTHVVPADPGGSPPPSTSAPGPSSTNTALLTWQTQYFAAAALADATKAATVWGDLADPDHDGRNNLLEYALGLNPLDPNDLQQGVSASLVTEGGQQHQYLTFYRRKNDPSLVYLPQVSGDHQNWSSGTNAVAELSATNLNTDLEVVRCEDLTVVGPGQARFFQLQVRRTAGPSSGAVANSDCYVATGVLIHGGFNGNAQFTYLSLSSVQPALTAGTVTALGANTLTDANVTWPTELLTAASGAYYLEFAYGLDADIIAADAPTKTLTLAGDLRPYLFIGAAYKVRRYSSLADVFGPHNEAGLAAGPSATAADNVVLRNNQMQTSQLYFFGNVGGSTGWYCADDTPAADIPIYLEQGIMVSRKADGDVVAYQSGVVKDGPTMAPISPGLNLVGTLKAARSMGLSELNLYTGDPASGLAGASTLAMADLLMVPGTGGTTLYFYCTDPANQGWCNAALQPAGNVQIAPGSAFYIMRNAPTAFQWIVPSE